MLFGLLTGVILLFVAMPLMLWGGLELSVIGLLLLLITALLFTEQEKIKAKYRAWQTKRNTPPVFDATKHLRASKEKSVLTEKDWENV